MKRKPTDGIDAELIVIAARRAQALDLVRRCHAELLAGYARENELLLERHALTTNLDVAAALRPDPPMIHR